MQRSNKLSWAEFQPLLAKGQVLGCLVAGLHDVDIEWCFESAKTLGYRLALVEGEWCSSPTTAPVTRQWLVVHPDDIKQLPSDDRGNYLGDQSEGYGLSVLCFDCLQSWFVQRVSD